MGRKPVEMSFMDVYFLSVFALVICFFLLLLLFIVFQGDAQFSEAVGYPMVQRWRVRSNLYRVKLSSITLSTGQCQNPLPTALINPQNRHYAAFTAFDRLRRALTGAV